VVTPRGFLEVGSPKVRAPNGFPQWVFNKGDPKGGSPKWGPPKGVQQGKAHKGDPKMREPRGSPRGVSEGW
jgi:hypothetical protein